MQTLKIEIPQGFVIDSFDQHSGEIKFKEQPKPVTERIKTIADVLADNKLTQKEFYEQCAGMPEDEVAYRILKLLAKSLNEGWTPDWDNSSQYKYFAYFWMGGSSGFRCRGYVYWHSTSDVGSRLCFKSRELAQHAGEQFTDVFKQFMLIK